MSLTKHLAFKKSSKRPCTDSENFRTIETDMAYNNCYKRATINMERVVRIENLENASILEVFEERTWTKLLNPIGNVYAELIREFLANAIMEGDHIKCWVQQKEFIITRDSIQEFLKIRPPSQKISIQYDDRLDSLEPMAELFGGFLKKKSMNTIPFNAKMRTLAYVMIHNLYPVTNLTTLSGPRTIFLYILPPDQEHHQEELKDNIAITESHYGFHRKDKAEDSKRSYHCVKRLSHWSSYRDPKQSPHHRIKNWHFSNPKG